MSIFQRIAEIFDAESWAQWFSELDRVFVFMLVLPFVVALIGLWAWYTDEERK